MNKELTPLQALENIIETFIDKDSEDIKTVRKALKRLEKLKECYENELKNTAYYNNLALKYKKALEIIKEHRLDIDWLLQFVKQDISYQHYVYCVEQSNNAFAKRFLLNDEEYELLKEVLK